MDRMNQKIATGPGFSESRGSKSLKVDPFDCYKILLSNKIGLYFISVDDKYDCHLRIVHPLLLLSVTTATTMLNDSSCCFLRSGQSSFSSSFSRKLLMSLSNPIAGLSPGSNKIERAFEETLPERTTKVRKYLSTPLLFLAMFEDGAAGNFENSTRTA